MFGRPTRRAWIVIGVAAAAVVVVGLVVTAYAYLSGDSAGLVNDNERRWRVFRQRVSEITEQIGADP
jgi:hypothetical protein